MALALVPPVGTAGIYKLAPPFSTLLQANMSYRCDAIRRIADFVEVGVEPFEEYYLPYGLTQAQYDQDMANQVCIVSLVSASGHWVYVPSTYIIAYPDLNGVPYTVMVLGLELGAIPNYRDLSGLKSVLSELCRDTIGVVPSIKEVAISAVQKLSQSDHDALETGRQNLINNTQTDRSKVIALTAELAALRQQYRQLEDYVKTHP